MLETCVKHRYGLAVNVAEFIHDDVVDERQSELLFGDAFFDYGLSFCPMYSLAKFLHNREGDHVGENKARLADFYFDRLDLI